jgi:transposase-like protein
MVQEKTNTFWQAEARSEATKKFIKDIKHITRRKFTAEEKIRIVLEGFRRDTPIRDLCRRKRIHPATYYAWLKRLSEGKLEDSKGSSSIPWNKLSPGEEAKILDAARASPDFSCRQLACRLTNSGTMSILLNRELRYMFFAAGSLAHIISTPTTKVRSAGIKKGINVIVKCPVYPAI